MDLGEGWCHWLCGKTHLLANKFFLHIPSYPSLSPIYYGIAQGQSLAYLYWIHGLKSYTVHPDMHMRNCTCYFTPSLCDISVVPTITQLTCPVLFAIVLWDPEYISRQSVFLSGQARPAARLFAS